MISDLSGEPLNAKADELDFDSIALFCGTGDDSRLLEYSPEVSAYLRTREPGCWMRLGVISRKLPSNRFVLRAPRGPRWTRISMRPPYWVLTTRWKASIGSSGTHQVSYHLVLNGEYEGVLLRHENQPRNTVFSKTD